MVYAAKGHRQNEGLLYRASTYWFYLLLNLGQPLKIPEDAHDFRQLRVDFVQQPRPHGLTKWNWRRQNVQDQLTRIYEACDFSRTLPVSVSAR